VTTLFASRVDARGDVHRPRATRRRRGEHFIDDDAREYCRALEGAREAAFAMLDARKCHPIMVRLAWHDAGTFDATAADAWPRCGGANGSIRFDAELAHGANAGLKKALGYAREIVERFPALSHADAIQLCGACAIESAGGPRIPMKYGRKDSDEPAREGNLPDAEAPFGDGSKTPGEHLRRVFGRLGFDDREIVALSGAHTIGRAFKERSGTTEYGYGVKNATKYTGGCPFSPKGDGDGDFGMPGGASWTSCWLKFDNSYFTEGGSDDKNLLWLSTDRVLHTDPGFAPHFMRYARDQDAFFFEFAQAFAKLSECGARWVVGKGGVYLPAADR
tara:strand:+ start:3370 stop:4368 length:999 start_codon:yes stop_codon:yes gene_type:complete